MEISHNVALVTGGASGLGLATVKELHANGAHVVILDLPSSRGKEIAGELGDRAVFSPGDVTSPDSVTAALDAAAGLGTLHINVNCAGIGNAMRTISKKGPLPLDIFKGDQDQPDRHLQRHPAGRRTDMPSSRTRTASAA